jgi:hypothetical protein
LKLIKNGESPEGQGARREPQLNHDRGARKE